MVVEPCPAQVPLTGPPAAAMLLANSQLLPPWGTFWGHVEGTSSPRVKQGLVAMETTSWSPDHIPLSLSPRLTSTRVSGSASRDTKTHLKPRPACEDGH